MAISDFKEMVENARKLKGYSQRELAKICGLPQSSIARIESCSVKPNVETLIKIADFLGTSTDYLLERINEPE